MQDWQFGAGIGVRYYSSFGPIRIDVGTPLNPRAGRRPRGGDRVARPGFLDGRRHARRPTGRRRRGGGCGSDWPRRLLNELLALFVALLILLLPVGAGAARYRAGASLHRRPHRPGSKPRRGSTSASAGSTDRCSASPGSRTSRCRDNRGVFLTSPEIELDWAPGAWLYNSLHIDRLVGAPGAADRACPSCRPTGRKGPILPGFDIHIGELAIDRLELGPAITGEARSGRVRGKADVRAGRAMVELGVAIDGGDRIALKPRRRARPRPLRHRRCGRASPANGLLPALVGTRRSIDLDVSGDGSWSRWRGTRARSTCRGGRPRGWRSASTTGAIGWPASSRRRNSSRASCSG